MATDAKVTDDVGALTIPATAKKKASGPTAVAITLQASRQYHGT
jgi:hypothetical protein